MKNLQLCTKQGMKKLQLCTKTAFTLKNIIYEQKDGASVGSSVGPLSHDIALEYCYQTSYWQWFG